MKIIKYITVPLLVILVLASCNKKVLEDDVVSDPDFFVEATLNGEEFSLIGGLDNVYVNPNFVETEDGFPLFNTSFSNTSCDICNENLTFEIVGNILGEDADINDILPIGFYDLTDFVAPYTSGFFNVSSVNDNFVVMELINVNNGDVYMLNNDSILPYLIDGDYSFISVNFFNSSLLEYTLGFQIENGQLCSPLPQIYLNNNIFSFDTNNSIEGIYTVTINDVLIPIFPGEEILLTDFIPILVTNFSIVIDFLPSVGNCTSSSTWNLLNDGIQNFQSNMMLVPTVVDIPQEELSVRISYTNELNTQYVSTIDNQGLFNISSISMYDNDNEDREAYLVEFTAGVQLVNVDEPNDFIELNIVDAIIPIVVE